MREGICEGLCAFEIGTMMECSQEDGIFPVNHILLNNRSMMARELTDMCLNIS